MVPFITVVQILLLLSGLTVSGLNILGLAVTAICLISIVFLQRYKLTKINSALINDPKNRQRGKQQTAVLSIGIFGFICFYVFDALAHIDTTGVSAKEAGIAAATTCIFLAVGLYMTRRR